MRQKWHEHPKTHRVGTIGVGTQRYVYLYTRVYTYTYTRVRTYTYISASTSLHSSPQPSKTICIFPKVRSQLHKFFPNYVAADPYQEIAQGMKLSTAYNALMHMPIFRWAKWSNEQIVCRHLETSWGMLKAPPRTGSGWWKGTTASPRKTSTDPTPTSTAGVAR